MSDACRCEVVRIARTVGVGQASGEETAGRLGVVVGRAMGIACLAEVAGSAACGSRGCDDALCGTDEDQ